MQIPVVDLNGRKTQTLELDDQRWSAPTNTRLLSQAIHMYRSNQRAGTASTKTRGDVSGGGKKPWKQKHTGRARAGSIRSPLWRHGGIVFGPHPKDFGYRLPKAMRRAALLESLKGKLQDQQLVVLNELRASEPKTKPFAGLAKTFGVERESLIVLEEMQEATVKSLRNLAHFCLQRADELNALDVLNADKVLLTRRAFERVQDRLDGRPLTTPEVPAPAHPVEAVAPVTPPARQAKASGRKTATKRSASDRTPRARAKRPAKKSQTKKRSSR